MEVHLDFARVSDCRPICVHSHGSKRRDCASKCMWPEKEATSATIKGTPVFTTMQVQSAQRPSTAWQRSEKGSHEQMGPEIDLAFMSHWQEVNLHGAESSPVNLPGMEM